MTRFPFDRRQVQFQVSTRSSTWDDNAAVGLVAGPFQPGCPGRIPALEHPAVRPGAGPGQADRSIAARPLLAGQEDLGHVPGHRDQVHLQGRQAPGVGVQPADVFGTRLAPGHRQQGSGRVGRGHLHAAPGQQAGQGAGAAADVQYGPGIELSGQGDVGVEVGAVRIQRIVELREPGFLEEGIGQAGSCLTGAGT